MTRPTNNYERKNIDFIETIAEIGEPFNSTLLAKYPEYKREISAYETDQKECFLSILNKIGEDGCQVLTDQIVNYIDDVSNVDTTIPSALLSQAESLGYPYKDKKTVQQLNRLSKCDPILQSLVWAVSTNCANSKTILNRLNIIDDERLNTDLSAVYNTDELNSKISADISAIFLKEDDNSEYAQKYGSINNSIFGRKYLYLNRNDDGKDVVTSKDAPSIMDFSWMLYSIFGDDIVENANTLNSFSSKVINFGKYNRTIYAIVCYNYLLSQLKNRSGISTQSGASVSIQDMEEMNEMAKTYMPFLYDLTAFDPIQAAWSILYDAKTISDYDIVYHDTINTFMSAFNEMLNSVSYDTVIDFIKEHDAHSANKMLSENINTVSKLNANSFSHQQLIVKIIADIKSLFGIDLKNQKYCNDFQSLLGSDFWESKCNKTNGFIYICPNKNHNDSLLNENVINWKIYISDIVDRIFDLGKRIRTLREDLRLMTLRNSYKGTTALIQFSAIEYLKDCIGDLIHQAEAEYNFKHNNNVKIPASVLQEIIQRVSTKDQSNVAVHEYWDFTEYYNRNFPNEKSKEIDSGARVDWYKPLDLEDPEAWRKNGSMNDNEIFNFYANILNLSKDIYLDPQLQGPGYVAHKDDPELNDLKQKRLRTFLQAVYNTGVFTERTDNDYEAMYSGLLKDTTNNSPWMAYKNTEYISKEIHPYIWNFSRKIVERIYKSTAVNISIQNAEADIIIKHIHKDGNIVDQYRLSENFVDSSGYVTRYEHRDHVKNERTLSYDGIIYPEFGYDLSHTWANWTTISSHKDEIIKKWYTDQTITLSEKGAKREFENIHDLLSNAAFMRSIYHNNSSNPAGHPSELSGVLKDYCIDKFETAYAVDPHNNHEIIYKENGYPFMRPLVNFGYDKSLLPSETGGHYNKGMLFVNADDSIDVDISIQNSALSNISDKFPRIVVSKDGTHILLRTAPTKLRSYSVVTHKNPYNEIEPALKLNAEISCDETLFDSVYFNDSLIKSIDDDFYILLPKYESSISAFTNYLLHIDGTGDASVTKQSFVNASISTEISTDIFGSGMFLNNGQNVIINTFYVNKTKQITKDSDVSAIYSDAGKAINNHRTVYNNWNVPDSSYDVFNQFVQMHASSEFNFQTSTNSFRNVFVNDRKSKTPTINLTVNNINAIIGNDQLNQDISVNNGYLCGYQNGNDSKPLSASTRLPFIRMFNINSDAGYNPVYIGETGKIILHDLSSQFALAKKTGAPLELLGPAIDFEANPLGPDDTSDVLDEVTDVNRGYERIHECYGDYENGTDLVKYSQSFDTSSEKRKTSYRYGYASIVENDAFKNDIYRIKAVQHKCFSVIPSNTDNNDNKQGYVQLNQNDKFQEIKYTEDSDSDYKYQRIYIFLAIGAKMYSIIPRTQSTKLQDINNMNTEFIKIAKAINEKQQTYSIEFENTYVFNKIEFCENGQVRLYGNVHELVNAEMYLVHVIGKKPDLSWEENYLPTPNFMLPKEELRKSLLYESSEISDDMINNHMRAPHTRFTKTYFDVKSSKELTDDSINDNITAKNGSIVFSLTEMDSEKMNRMMPDQQKDHDIKSVTPEAINAFRRYAALCETTFSTLKYNFVPYKFIDLNLSRKPNPEVDTGIDETESAVEKEYIVQPYDGSINIQQDASNKYTISFWRKSEKDTTEANNQAQIDNVLPNYIKITENNITPKNRPIFSNEHESINNILTYTNFVPRLMVQWEYKDFTDKSSPIRLRFTNSVMGDASFINTNAGLEYKSLSTYSDSIVLEPGERKCIDIVAPNHIQIGRTVFYNIPLMRALVTNISDDKPKFMLTILNDKSDKRLTLESNNYALVFMSSSTPQNSHSDIVYTTCYVAPMLTANQPNPPSVSNAVVLSELAFNFDIANIINIRNRINDAGNEVTEAYKSLVESVTPIIADNKISQTAQSYVSIEDNVHQIRISEPFVKHDPKNIPDDYGFITIDIKLNLQNLTKVYLKNAMLTAHGTVIAYDNAGTALPVSKIFGCTIDRIGPKYVLGNKQNEVLTVTQNSGRETAILVNPESVPHGINEGE